MPIYRGVHYGRVFLFTDEAGEPIPITGWELLSHVRGNRADGDPPLLILSTENGGWEVIDGPGGKLQLNILADETALLTPTKIIFDVLRTDIDPGPDWLFEATVPVKDPVTRV